MVAQWNTIAKERGWSPFVLYQGHYSIGLRDMEREVLPAVTSLNMSAIPWGVIGGGKYTGKFKRGGQKDEDAKRAGTVMTERDYDIADKVAEVAKRHGATMGQVCIAWTLRQPGINTILIGQRTVKQLKENIAALEIELSEQDLKDLDEVSKIDLGFPNTFLGGTRKEENRFTLTAPGKIVFKNF